MIDRILEGTKVLQKGLEGTRSRHNAILTNIANLETPGYKRKIVHFEDDLREALGEKGADNNARMAAISKIHPRVEIDDHSLIRFDQNTVDIDKESAELAENTLRYLAMLEIIRRDFKGMHRAMAPSA